MINSTEDRWQTLHELIAAARLNLSQNLWDYLIGGAATETTVRRNRSALDRIGFRPRVLQDVSYIDPTAHFSGHHIRLPIILSVTREDVRLS